MKVVHYPMSAPSDDTFDEIAKLIVDQRINTVVGMPSTLHRLFSSQQPVLQAYGGVRKVMLGGEHLGQDSHRLLQQCGVARICSAIYGTVDAGPLGHACIASDNGVFHLMDGIQSLEIVHLEQDKPVAPGETGRMLFTSRIRQARPSCDMKSAIWDAGYPAPALVAWSRRDSSYASATVAWYASPRSSSTPRNWPNGRKPPFKSCSTMGVAAVNAC